MAQQITQQEAQEAIDPRHIALGRRLAVGTSICLIGSQQHIIPRVVTPADLGTLSVGQYHLVLLFGGNDDAQRARWMQAVHSPLWKAGLGGVVVETGGSSGVADLWVAHPLLPDRQVVLHQAAQEAEIITAVITSGQVARLPFPTNEHLPLLSQYMGTTMAHLVNTAQRPPWTCAVMNAADVASYDAGLLTTLAMHGRFYRVRSLVAVPDPCALERGVQDYLLANASAVLVLPTCDTAAAQAIAATCKDVWKVDLDVDVDLDETRNGAPENAPHQAILITGEEAAC